MDYKSGWSCKPIRSQSLKKCLQIELLSIEKCLLKRTHSMNRKPRYKEVVVDFVDRVHGTGFPEIRPWRPRLAIPVEFVDVVRGTDGSDGASSLV